MRRGRHLVAIRFICDGDSCRLSKWGRAFRRVLVSSQRGRSGCAGARRASLLVVAAWPDLVLWGVAVPP